MCIRDSHYVAQNDESYGFGRRRRELSERRRLLEEDTALPMLGAVPAPAAAPRTARSLESLMDNLGESFTTRLLRLIDERGLKDSTVYKMCIRDRYDIPHFFANTHRVISRTCIKS